MLGITDRSSDFPAPRLASVAFLTEKTKGL